MKPAPDTYDVLPTAPTHWDDRAHDRWMVPTLVPGPDFPAESWAPRDFWGSDFPSGVRAPAVRDFVSDRPSGRGSRGSLSKSVRVFGFLTMALAALVVVLDCLVGDQKSSVFAAEVVGVMFTVGAFLAAPRK